MDPTINEPRQKTQHGDWKGRARNHELAILDLAAQRKRETGVARLSSAELYSQPQKFGRAFRNRISELHQKGVCFRDKRLNPDGSQLGHWEGHDYVWVIEFWPDTLGVLPTQKEMPWDKRPRVETDNYGRPLQFSDAGPLFGGSAA